MLGFILGVETTLIVEIILLGIYTYKQINGGNKND